MKNIFLISAFALSLGTGAATAQSANETLRVTPGFFCSQNKCVRFSQDLQTVSIQARNRVSVASFGLSSDPVITAAQFDEIFALALRQNNTGTDR